MPIYPIFYLLKGDYILVRACSGSKPVDESFGVYGFGVLGVRVFGFLGFGFWGSAHAPESELPEAASRRQVSPSPSLWVAVKELKLSCDTRGI